MLEFDFQNLVIPARVISGVSERQVNAYSVSATKIAVVSAGTLTVPSLGSNVDFLVVGSLEFRCTGCRYKAKPCRRLFVKVTDA